jgi:hypothetical protein
MQDENEKAVRDLFEQEMGPRLIHTLGTLAMQRYNGERKDRYIFQDTQFAWEAWQAALQSQVSNTQQDGPNIQSLNICPRNSGHPHMFSKPGTIDSCRHCGLSEREWKVKAEAKLLAAQTPQQQEQSGEEFDVARLGNIRVIMNKYGWPDEIVDAAVRLSPAPPTSTAIAAMVIKQAAQIFKDFRSVAWSGDNKNWLAKYGNVSPEELLSNLTPANAEAELVKVIMKVINEAHEYTEEGVRRVLDEKGE